MLRAMSFVRRFGVAAGLLAVAASAGWTAAAPRAAKQAATPAAIAAADNDFGMKLFAELRKTDVGKNVFISPTSVALALDMTWNGAGGKTRDAMADALSIRGWKLDNLNAANVDFTRSIRHADPSAQLKIANSIWTAGPSSLKPAFVHRCKQFYDAPAARAKSAADINTWVSKATEGKIPSIVERLGGDDLFLVDAVYFKGTWAHQFDRHMTRDAAFLLSDGGQITVPMMKQSTIFAYLGTKEFQAVRLPYRSGRLALYVFLPAEGSDLKEFLGSLNSARWNAWMGQFKPRSGSVELPRFKAEYDTMLNDPLTALGMGIAFGRGADFSGIDPGLFIDYVRHRTFVDVNEEGTDAAGATVVAMTKGVRPGAFRMVVNRPFFCAIRDSGTGAILFMGAIEKP